ncbi:MAG: MlaE family lipid ABC transporter permease subunit [Rhizobiales bacterium]|nr:MlaE family lipid ABC transporter permease subunit [Hyphomicrobiales bacterium]
MTLDRRQGCAAGAAGPIDCESAEHGLQSDTLLTSALKGERLEVAAGGAWTARHAPDLEPLVEAAATGHDGARSVTIDVREIRELDTYGAWLLERLVRERAARGQDTSIVNLPERYRELIADVQHVNRVAPPKPAKENRFVGMLATIGQTTAETGRDLLSFVQMLGMLMIALARVITRPKTFRLTSMVHHLDRVGWQAVPIILLITFLIGAIIAQQGIFHFRKFGADVYVVDMVGILVLREIGVLIVAIMVAGRSGSAYTAEIGSMKMREEIDALRTMGFDPVEVLILPRVLALVIGLPILAFLGAMAALYGGGLVAWLYGGISPDIFMSRLREAISTTHFQVGMIKAPFMALVIGVVAGDEGMRVKGSSESLGAQTTSSVVKSIFLVIVLDGLFAIFFASIGM